MINQYLAPLIALTLIVIGALATFFPKWMSTKFGIPANENAIPYVISTGIRDVCIGLIVYVAHVHQQWELLGVTCFGLACVALSDFVVVRKNGDKKLAYTHMCGAVLAFASGVWFLV